MRFLPAPIRPILAAALLLLPGSAAGGEVRLAPPGWPPPPPEHPFLTPLLSPTFSDFTWQEEPKVSREDASPPPHRDLPGGPRWLFGEVNLGFFGSNLGEARAIDVGGETFSYDDIWGGGFGPRLQGRLHFGILRRERAGLTVGPGLFIESAGYGMEGGAKRLFLQDGTTLDPQYLFIWRWVATVHGRYLFSRGFFVGAQIGVGYGFTEEAEIKITDPGGTETRQTLFRQSRGITWDLSVRAGWRWGRSRVGWGGYFEAGVVQVGSPRRGDFAGADPDPIRMTYFGAGVLLEFGSVRP